MGMELKKKPTTTYNKESEITLIERLFSMNGYFTEYINRNGDETGKKDIDQIKRNIMNDVSFECSTSFDPSLYMKHFHEGIANERTLWIHEIENIFLESSKKPDTTFQRLEQYIIKKAGRRNWLKYKYDNDLTITKKDIHFLIFGNDDNE